NPSDHLVAQQGIEMVRYADDFVIMCRSEVEAQRALALGQQWTAAAGLTLHPEKTRIVDAIQHGGFDFLGYDFERGLSWPWLRRPCVNPLRSEPSTGEPDAGKLPVRFGGRGSEANRLSLPL